MNFLSLIPGVLKLAEGLTKVIPGETDDRILAFAQKFAGAASDIIPIVKGSGLEGPEGETLEQLVTRIEADSERVGRKLRGE